MTGYKILTTLPVFCWKVEVIQVRCTLCTHKSLEQETRADAPILFWWQSEDALTVSQGCAVVF